MSYTKERRKDKCKEMKQNMFVEEMDKEKRKEKSTTLEIKWLKERR